MVNTKLYREWIAADDAWATLLRSTFGKRAGDVRYTAPGRGDPGSALRAAHDAFVAAGAAYHEATRAVVTQR